MKGFLQTSKRFLSLQFFAGFLFPPTCVECGVRIHEDLGLCPGCWQNISYIEKPLCDRLGIPFDFDPGRDILSAEALACPPPYERARYVAKYDGVARSLVQKIKYRDQTYLGKFMGGLMVRFGADLLSQTDIILPVPLHRRRLFMRRFNQASLLASEISRKTKIPVHHLVLSRRRATRSQIGLKAKERQKNVSGAFSIVNNHKGFLRGKQVLLVDDVVTTGSTIESCTKTILEAGAAGVNILAFARVTDRVKTL